MIAILFGNAAHSICVVHLSPTTGQLQPKRPAMRSVALMRRQRPHWMHSGREELPCDRQQLQQLRYGSWFRPIRNRGIPSLLKQSLRKAATVSASCRMAQHQQHRPLSSPRSAASRIGRTHRPHGDQPGRQRRVPAAQFLRPDPVCCLFNAWSKPEPDGASPVPDGSCGSLREADVPTCLRPRSWEIQSGRERRAGRSRTSVDVRGFCGIMRRSALIVVPTRTIEGLNSGNGNGSP